MEKGFTLIELLITISIVGILSLSVISSLAGAIEQTKYNKTGRTKLSLAQAAQLYWIDTGFYPPDVGRGWDPGFERKNPWNSDLEDGDPGAPTSTNVNCDHCPSNWEEILDQSWNGPYLTEWPDETEWGGEYDYNYWPNPTNRSGCIVSPGIYAGAQRNYSNDISTQIPTESEQALLDLGLDDDLCLNLESQLKLHSIEDL